MMPASNMKIVTLAAAAETLGWDYRFKTTLETTGAGRERRAKGDLIVRGSGDPTINSRANRASACSTSGRPRSRRPASAASTGASSATRARSTRGLGQGWSWDYLQYGYAAPVGALEFNENIATLSIRPGAKAGDDAALELTPGAGLGLIHHVRDR